MSFIIAEDLTKHYGSGNSAVTAIKNISFNVEVGEFITIMGESGAGKSTLLSIMGAINSPSAGRYVVDGIDVYGLKQEKQADFRREFLGFVFQSFYLIPYLTVLENVMLPLTTASLSRQKKRGMAEEALDWVGLSEKGQRLPHQISGGEMERVAIARAIVNDPPILLADEPTGNLDSRNTQEMMALLGRLNAEGMTIILVTHSAECARHAQRILTLADGKLMKAEASPISGSHWVDTSAMAYAAA
jgi:putative ABC transport system ATP-binding protein